MKKLSFLLLFTVPLLVCMDGPKLVNTQIFEGITVSLPKDFVIMSEEDVAKKFPSTKKPAALYTNMDRTVDFGLNISKFRWASVDINFLHKIYKSTILETYDKVEFIKDTVVNINGRPFSAYEYISYFDKTKSYNYMLFSVLAQTNAETKEEPGLMDPSNAYRVLIFNFYCPYEYAEKWMPYTTNIMNYIKINAKKASKAIPQVEAPKVKGLTNPKAVLEDQKKRGTKKK